MLILTFFLSGIEFLSCSNKDKVEPIKNIEYSLVLDKQDEDIVIGEELIITPTINNNAQALTYIWTSSDNTVATVIFP